MRCLQANMPWRSVSWQSCFFQFVYTISKESCAVVYKCRNSRAHHTKSYSSRSRLTEGRVASRPLGGCDDVECPIMLSRHLSSILFCGCIVLIVGKSG